MLQDKNIFLARFVSSQIHEDGRVFSVQMTSCAVRYDVIYHPSPINSQFKVDRLQIIVVAKNIYIYESQLFISRMAKMRAIPQLVLTRNGESGNGNGNGNGNGERGTGNGKRRIFKTGDL